VETAGDQDRSAELVTLEIGDDVAAELRERGARDRLAPDDEAALTRYGVYLGMGYLEAEEALADCEDDSERYARLHRLLGSVEGGEATLRFTYAEDARRHADEQRAAAAHDRMASAYVDLIEKLRAEIAVREERIANLRQELGA
jgi:hypothetical protein